MKRNDKTPRIIWSDASSRLVSIYCQSGEILRKISEFAELRHQWSNGITYLVNKDKDFDKAVNDIRELLGGIA